MQLFAVRDNKAEAYGPPFMTRNQVVAIRSISDAMKDTGSPWHTHPEDFSLYHVASYDDETAVVDGSNGPVHICNFIDIVDSEAKED